MRTGVFLLILAACGANAQTPAQPPAANPAKPAAAPRVPPETVVATLEGRPVTAGEMEKFVKALPPQLQQGWTANKRGFMQQYALLRKLTEMAEKAKLDQQSPYKEAIEYSRMELLARAQISDAFNRINVTPDEQKKYYEERKDDFAQAKVKVIYTAFSAAPPVQTDPQAKKVLSEEEAKAKAQSILAELRKGADFLKMVKEHSDDPVSAGKDGDFGNIRRNDKLPQEVKDAVFALKPGQISEPVRQPNGFYIFRLEEFSTQPYEQVQAQILQELRNAHMKQWLDAAQQSAGLKIENEAFFAPAAPTPAPAAPAAK